MLREEGAEPRSGMTAGTLLYGLFVLVAIYLAVSVVGSVGLAELLVWLALVVGWVTYWFVRRTRSRPDR